MSPDKTGFSSCAAIITIGLEQIVLQLRDENPSIFFPGYFGLFGGGIEPGERPLEAIVREVAEELSITFDPRRFEHMAVMEFSCSYFCDGMVRRRFFFTLDIEEDELEKMQLCEGQSIGVFSLYRLPEPQSIVPTDLMPLMMFAAKQSGKAITPV